ncbi:aspartic proteinase CDR1-like [Impatiens glandulifera]|uniref:aspartic proteinase CDR1-like n=1 Tax=Impatiens glandulifera TaxID=253017 RepID=UPI001FB12B13|nr:aspartic proteinase CDR1-like [Impatiens glandulifera]
MVSIAINYLLILVVVLQLSVYASNTSKLISFSTYLIHRDSLESPLYDSSTNKTNFLERAILRSSSRLSHLKSISKFPNDDPKEINSIDSTVSVSTVYEYLIEISIGTPPIKQLVIFDTGSDNVWTQCLPCVNCFRQTQPKFNSKRSRSYNILTCGGKECGKLGNDKTCEWRYGKCTYTLKYLDNSSSSGDLAMETFKLGNNFFRKMVYGCSNNNIGEYHHTIAGIAGFGPGPHSLISQLSDMVGGKFAYCLVHYSKINTRSKISFGASAIVSGRSTPLVSEYITLEGISVENMAFPVMVGHQRTYTRIPFRSQAILDTGALQSYLPTDLYQQLENFLINVIKLYPTIKYGIFQNCYRFYPNFPTLILHFSRGAELILTRRNTIINNKGLWCLVINPSFNGETIIGSLLQMDYMIGYDLKNGSVSFRATNCSDH